VVNWGEVYYNTMREVSQEAAEQKAREIASLPIDLVGVGDDLALVRQAAIFKATHKMSYADCLPPRWPSSGTPSSSPATRSSKWSKGNQNCVVEIKDTHVWALVLSSAGVAASQVIRSPYFLTSRTESPPSNPLSPHVTSRAFRPNQFRVRR